MHIVTQIPTREVVEKIGKVASGVNIGVLERRHLGWSGKWEYGSLLVQEMDADARGECRESTGIPDPKTLIWLSCDLRDEGVAAACRIFSSLLKEWEGDLALMPDGDEVLARRISGKLILYKDHLNAEHLKLFQQPL